MQLGGVLDCDSVKYIESRRILRDQVPRVEDRRQSPEEDLLRADRKLASQLGEAVLLEVDFGLYPEDFEATR